jgi:3'(2'), 5'-bisphosphate nucleotidase
MADRHTNFSLAPPAAFALKLSMLDFDFHFLAHGAEELTRGAGKLISAIYSRPFNVETKDDRSPVTEADRQAEEFIIAGLSRLTPDLPIVAEESVAQAKSVAGAVAAITPRSGAFWLVDPLDGTREFINRRDEFTVNIGLIVDQRPVLGAVHSPVGGMSYVGATPLGAWRRNPDGEIVKIFAKRPDSENLAVLISRSHNDAATDAWLHPQTKNIAKLVPIGSSIKFCRIAEGDFDLYPRFGRTNEWDTAAGHAVLAAAGGSVRTLDGKNLTYGKPEFGNPPYIARGRD